MPDDTTATADTSTRTRPAQSTELDLIGGYIRHVTELNRATNAYTLNDARRIARYAHYAHLSDAEHQRLRALVQLLADTPNR